MADGVLRGAVRRNAYADSVALLQVTASVAALPGVLEASLVMATELNLEVLRDSGLLFDEAAGAGPNDLLIAVRGQDEAAAEAGVGAAERLLAERKPAAQHDPTRQAPRSIRSAHRALPGANLAIISVPGPYAAAEARQALAEGMHVFLFSDNVSLEDEIDLKQRAREKALLVMGPDCGTAILNGVGLGFANVVRRGKIGLIGASGTGVQEVSTLLTRAGVGISHAIGTGGRDLHARVGAVTTLQALDVLRDDPATERIVLISKPPDSDVAQRVLSAAAATGKPVVACFLGASLNAPAGIQLATNLYQAARLAAPDADWSSLGPESLPRVRREAGQDQVRALYCGGTLRDEAELAIGHANGHEFVDFGDDRYTRGRAHPMIDPSLRNQAIVAAGADPRVAVLLLDVILGYGAHADPAAAIVPVVGQLGGRVSVLAHVVGTASDPQGLERQEQALRAAGVHLFGSNHHAAVAAGLLVEGA
jgi:succinyl-CoA synthetase alpha subunit